MMKPTTLILSLCFLIGEPMAPPCFAQAKEDKRAKQLQNEKRKLGTTANPANRAKSLMRIAEITLSYMSDAANAKDFTAMQAYVEQYRKAVTDARDTMMMSGLDPYKKSGGYRTVETALRKQLRNLQDIARLLTVDERQPLDETIQMVSKIRDEFIQALFGVKAASGDLRSLNQASSLNRVSARR
jgi:hypothetical protein